MAKRESCGERTFFYTYLSNCPTVIPYNVQEATRYHGWTTNRQNQWYLSPSEAEQQLAKIK